MQLVAFARALMNRPYATVFALLTVFFFAYLAGVEMEASVFADGAGRWLQIQGLLAQNFTTFACDYDTAFDPEFRWRPGPWYFYYLVDDVCFYFYQYPYALLAAPFVYWLPDYGYFLLNFACLALFVFATMRTAREIFQNSAAELAAGLIAFLVIPSPTFAYDLSEVMLFLAMLACGLWLVVRGLGWQIGPALADHTNAEGTADEVAANSVPIASRDASRIRSPRSLLFGGLLVGLAFALRTEAVIFLAAVTGALLLVRFALFTNQAGGASGSAAGAPTDSDDDPTLAARVRAAIATATPFVLGAMAGLMIVCAFHYSVFGNLTGNRGAAHTDQVLAEFTIGGQLEIARLLLFGGSLGLFSSLPSIALAFLWAIFPGARRAAGPIGAFFFVLSVAYIAAVLVVAPNDGGYSWSPRYLACVFAPLYLCILAIFWRWKILHRFYIYAALAALALYSVHFTHTGMKILQRTSKQNLTYSRAVESFDLDLIVFDAPPAMGFLSEKILSEKRIYMALDKESARDLAARLAETGVREFIYIRTPLRAPSLELETRLDGGGVFRSTERSDVGGMQIHRMRFTEVIN